MYCQYLTSGSHQNFPINLFYTPVSLRHIFLQGKKIVMKKIYSFIFTLLFKHFLRITAKEENKTTWQTNLYYMYFCRKCLYFSSFLKNKIKKNAGTLIIRCLTCDSVSSSKDVELPLWANLANSSKCSLLKSIRRDKTDHKYSQVSQEQLAERRGRNSP